MFETYIFAIGSGGTRAIHLVAWQRVMRGEIALIAMPLYHLYLDPFGLERDYLPQSKLYIVTHLDLLLLLLNRSHLASEKPY